MKVVPHTLIRMLTIGVLFFGSSAVCLAQTLPGASPDRGMIKIQQKADKLFEKGDFERAMFIYSEELAPIGDKFAQYMVGYMHYSGSGVPADPVLASAYYRLAAERGEESYVKLRDILMGLLNDEQRARSDETYAQLRAEIGDIALVTNLVNEDLLMLRSYKGDDEIFKMRVFGRSNFKLEDDAAFKEVAERLNERTVYLLDIAYADKDASPDELEQVRLLEVNVMRELATFESKVEKQAH